MPKSVNEMRVEQLQQDMQLLIAQYKDISQSILLSLNPVERVVLRERYTQIENEIRQIENEIGQLETLLKDKSEIKPLLEDDVDSPIFEYINRTTEELVPNKKFVEQKPTTMRIIPLIPIIGILIIIGGGLLFQIPYITPTPSSVTNTFTPTIIPTEIADTAFVVRSIVGQELGNGTARVYYTPTIKYPETVIIELELYFNNYYVTPTPFGARTAVPANTITPLPKTTLIATTPTPRILQYDGQPEMIEIQEFMGVALICLPSSFDGCISREAEHIPLRGKTWRWIITPKEGISGKQNLSIQLWQLLSMENGNNRLDVVWEYPFSLDVISSEEQPLITFLRQNFAPIISAVATILVALIGGGYLISKRSSEKSTQTVRNLSEKSPRIFISYRRSLSQGFAKLLHDRLQQKGVSVFLDIHDIHEGKFSEPIQKSIEQCDFFIVFLAPETLQSEWVVKEILHAFKCKRVVIPVLHNNFDLYGTEVTKNLKKLQQQNAIKIDPEYVDAAIEKIEKFVGLTSEE